MRYRGVAVALLAALLLAVAPGGAAVAAAAPAASQTSADAAAAPQTLSAVQDQPDADPNETVRHEHPDQATGVGDDAAVAGWLIDRLTWSLEDSAVELSEGEYERGRELLGPEYRDRLDQYADVAGDTNWQTEDPDDPRTRDEVAAEEFAAVRETQAELADLLVEYEETLAAFETARDAGQEQRALELARELVALGDRIEALGGDLDQRYDRIEAIVERDLSGASASVANVTEATNEETDRVAEDAFAETTLTVDVRDGTASPADPLVVTGRLVDEDGDPIEGATIAVADPVEPVAADVGAATAGRERIGSGANTTATTDADGQFRLEHRPLYVPLDTDELTVEYRPARLSPHRAAAVPVDVTVEQVEGTVHVANVPDEVGFGDSIDVGLVASAADEPADGVPFWLRFGNASTAGVTADGTLQLSEHVPRDVAPGEHELRVVAPLEAWSVAFEPHTATVTVVETETSLSASATSSPSGVTVSGRLEAADGTPVPDAPVTVEAPGAATDVTRTDEDGRYSTSVATDAGGSVTVRYAESGSNLADASASAALPGSGGGGGAARGLLARLGAAASSPLGALALTGAGLVCAGLVVWRRAQGTGREEVPSPSSEPSPEPAAAASADDGFEPARLDVAERLVDDAPDRAAVLAYAAGRQALADDVPASSDATHREFLRACAEAGLDADVIAAVRDLTDCYEEAAYAPDAVDAATARSALAAAETLQRAVSDR